MKLRAWMSVLLAAELMILAACNQTESTPSGSGKLYLTTQGDTKVSTYDVNLGDGTVTLNSTQQDTGTTPNSIALTPAGDALFVANRGDNTITSYAVGSDGTLSAGNVCTSLMNTVWGRWS